MYFLTLSIYFSCPVRLMLLFNFLYNLQKFNLFFQSVPSQASSHQLCSHSTAARAQQHGEGEVNEVTCAFTVRVFLL